MRVEANAECVEAHSAFAEGEAGSRAENPRDGGEEARVT
jgi:hypothetical protein